MDLLECRRQLDEIDKKVVELFEERMRICGEVAESKIESGKAVYDGEREKQKLEAVGAMAHGEYNQNSVQELFAQMMTISRRYQYRLLAEHGKVPELGFHKIEELPRKGVKVVYQGVEGAYQHAAALKYFGEDVDCYHVATFEDPMKEVQEGHADYAVLPIENSSAGAVVDIYDLLIRYQNYIVGEIYLPVDHCLLTLEETKPEDIRTVYSHPQALMQCSEYLNAEKDWQKISVANTALAACKVKEEEDKTQAAVASEIAGKLYGLKVLKKAIQNNQGNTTRFIILAKNPVYVQDASKVSLCFELPHQSGALYNMLGNFIFNHVNMLMIESRPIPGRNWEYRFFVDIEGNLDDAAVQNALKGITEEALNTRILGNY